jgi:hypothetical protein
VVAILGFVGAWFGSLLDLQSVEGISETGSVLPLLAVSGLMLILLAASAIDDLNFLRVAGALIVIVLGLVPAAAGLVINKPALGYSDGRIVPSIIQAESDSGSEQRTLKLSLQDDGTVVTELIWGDGVKLHEASSAYRYVRTTLQQDDERYELLGQLVANLVSANGAKLDSAFAEFNIGYVLISPINENLGLALDSTSDLESIGETDFGQLWKVRSATVSTDENRFEISNLKIVQLSLLIFLLLLAIPTSSNNRKRNNRESSIFVDNEEEATN